MRTTTNEGLGFEKRENQIDAIRHTVAWFDKYLSPWLKREFQRIIIAMVFVKAWPLDPKVERRWNPLNSSEITYGGQPPRRKWPEKRLIGP
jgi:hypothetical protein